jgi:hypothetical protein
MHSEPTYVPNFRKVGTTTFFSLTQSRGGVTATSAEIALPPVVEYDSDGRGWPWSPFVLSKMSNS